jgi:hypothetical protein
MLVARTELVLALLSTARNWVDRGQVRPERLSFAAAARRVGVLSQRLPRTETVDVARINGSVDRARELGADFRPARRWQRTSDNQRFERIRTRMQRGACLPAVELYKLGPDYYVLDGHHRVAAALSLGQLAIDARVTEWLPTKGGR